MNNVRKKCINGKTRNMIDVIEEYIKNWWVGLNEGFEKDV